jgi:hypothetical protein
MSRDRASAKDGEAERERWTQRHVQRQNKHTHTHKTEREAETYSHANLGEVGVVESGERRAVDAGCLERACVLPHSRAHQPLGHLQEHVRR